MTIRAKREAVRAKKAELEAAEKAWRSADAMVARLSMELERLQAEAGQAVRDAVDGKT